jgi:hypothetical protein
MENRTISSDRPARRLSIKANKIRLSDFLNNGIEVNRPAVVLCTSHESDDGDQISVLEQVIHNIPLDISIYVPEKDCLPAFEQQFKVKGYPTYLLFISGIERDRFLGKADYANLNHFILKHLSPGKGRK